MIEDYIRPGAQNAITGKELAKKFGCNIRIITAQIEKARRSGIPICANANGYYLAETQKDIEIYTSSLKGRAIELFKTRKALLEAGEDLPQ